MMAVKSVSTAAAALVFAAAVLLAGDAYAHKVNVFAYAKGGEVHAKCYYADGSACAGSTLTVSDESGGVLLEGTTDSAGKLSFAIPGPGPLTLTLSAGMGHAGTYTLTAKELDAAGGGGSKGRTRPTEHEPAENGGVPEYAIPSPYHAEGGPAGRVGESGIGTEELRRVVDETVEARLEPLYSMLSDMKSEAEKPSLSEVIGGLGYIFGLMGLYMYFRSRKA